MAKDPEGRKTCSECGHEKPIEQFQKAWNNQRSRYYRKGICKVCRNMKRRAQTTSPEELARRRERYASDPEYRRKVLNSQHRGRYGITLDEKEAMLAAQGGVCAACGRAESKGHGWATDHDHSCCPGQKSCGKCVRAVLCTNCNVALGHVGDDLARIEGLAAYVRRQTVSRMNPI